MTDEREMLRRTLRAERLAAVGTLAAGLAHEVRNPLNSANLQLQVLKRRLGLSAPNAAELLNIVDIVGDEIRRLEPWSRRARSSFSVHSKGTVTAQST